MLDYNLVFCLFNNLKSDAPVDYIIEYFSEGRLQQLIQEQPGDFAYDIKYMFGNFRDAIFP
ncbi:hypothetical protein JXB41_01040 [Candidatus Woesearchaeota archaeon]|nr:hypothetical protein [Candidatus Woesearchaeota archaeon]